MADATEDFRTQLSLDDQDEVMGKQKTSASPEQTTEQTPDQTTEETPVAIHFEDVSAAAFRVKSGIRNTPCVKSERLSELMGMEVFCKEDYMQVTGSFKERGARNALLLLDKEQKKIGVVTASAGNHALALAYHGKRMIKIYRNMYWARDFWYEKTIPSIKSHFMYRANFWSSINQSPFSLNNHATVRSNITALNGNQY